MAMFFLGALAVVVSAFFALLFEHYAAGCAVFALFVLVAAGFIPRTHNQTRLLP